MHRLPPQPLRGPGFTLVELLLVIAIVGILVSLALPALQETIDRARVARAIGDIRAMQAELASLDSLPTSLAAIGRAGRQDPWGNAYVYLKLASSKSAVAAARKDRFLVPLNSDYDLYSVGKDGQSQAPLIAPVSQDDVLRANNGAYIGLASKY